MVQIIAASDEPDDAPIGNEDAITLNFDHTSLFLADRFTGFDRYEGGTRANAGVVYNLLGGNGGFLRASLGESFHVAGRQQFRHGLRARRHRLPIWWAPWPCSPTTCSALTYQARVEEDLSRINVQEASHRPHFRQDFRLIELCRHQGRRGLWPAATDEQQVWGDANYRLGEAWSLFGGFRYDLRGQRLHGQDHRRGLRMRLHECAAWPIAETREDDTGGTERQLSCRSSCAPSATCSGGFGF